MPTKMYDKTEVDYGPGHVDSHCGRSFTQDKNYCKHFMPAPAKMDRVTIPGRCQLVGGTIRRTYWCKLFKRAHA